MSLLSQIIFSRLVEDTQIDSLALNFVESAFGHEDAVRLLATENEYLHEPSVVENESPIPRAFLKTLEVTGFRGIAKTTTLKLDACPGLTLVIGRNGSGKSSLAEAFEVVLTGKSSRYKDKNADWLKGWKNIHHTGRIWVRGSFLIENERSDFKVKRSWGHDEGTTVWDYKTETTDNPSVSLEAWKDAIETFRPILSYNEFGATLDKGPSHLYDFVRKVLGLEEITTATKRLAEVSKTLKLADKTKKECLKDLEIILQNSTDSRAESARGFLQGRKKNIEGLTDLCIDEAIEDSDITLLRKVATLKIPELDAILEVSELLRDADHLVKKATTLSQTQEGKAFGVLKLAVESNFEEEDDCPVCHTPNMLSAQWKEDALKILSDRDEINQLKQHAGEKKRKAIREGNQILRSLPMIPHKCTLSSRDAAFFARENWVNAPEDLVKRAGFFEQHFERMVNAYTNLREEAKAELKALHSEWIPIQHSIIRYLDAHQESEKNEGKIKAIKQATDWLKKIDAELREERLAPIREQTQKIWKQLAHRSNVSLEGLRLEGSSTKRKLSIDVSVDGKEATALGVMSQGELHALLLSLFLPRLTSDQSPFKFLIIDDPVQAMDPAKVDGLARVLAEVAKTRQVVVFTHDARLPAAVRRMEIPTRVIEVSRGENSTVKLNDKQNRAKQFLDDAWMVKDDRNKFGPSVAQNVIPGLCRSALEAHLQTQVWEKLLKEGVDHREIEIRLNDVKEKGVQKLAALALLGDANKGGEVFTYLKNKSRYGIEAFKEIKQNAHGGFRGDIETLIKNTRTLLQDLGAIL